MLDGKELRRIIELEKPDLIVPEIEAIATDTLLELEREGFTVVPTGRAAKLTMNREGIRRLAAEQLGLPTSPYRFADNEKDFRTAVAESGVPMATGSGWMSIRLAAWDMEPPDKMECPYLYADNGDGKAFYFAARYFAMPFAAATAVEKHACSR